jgi:AraC-like DNA-binding protein
MINSDERLPSRMLIGRDRLFYSGLVGNSMKTRCLGAVTVYVATGAPLQIRIADGAWETRLIVALPPFTPHRLRTPSGFIATIGLEPETIDRHAIDAFIAHLNKRPEDTRLIRRILAARREVTMIRDMGGFSTDQFDHYFLRQALQPRNVDVRIRRVLDKLVDDLQDNAISASACAGEIGLSTSRFLHLFKDNTGIPFRSQRMWKRARRFLDHANREDSLTDVALGLGYPDSSHFSHSIRASFGLQPRSIREGSRGMQVCVGENYALSHSFACSPRPELRGDSRSGRASSRPAVASF